MKAIICPKYGPPEVLRLVEVEKPTPKDNEVCIKIRATAVTNSDIFIRGSKLPIQYWIPMRIMIGLRRPRKSIIGLVLAGEIEAIGRNVTRYQPGDQVYGMTGFGLGTYAEYTCMAESSCLAIKPANITDEEAVGVVYGGLLAWQYLQRGGVQTAKNVLIYGASGSSGTMAVQLAKHFGAKVTGVCSTRNLEMVKVLGADAVLDYTKQDSPPAGARYDLVLDAVGRAKTSTLKEACRKALTPQGRYVSIDDGDLKLRPEWLDQLRAVIETGDFQVIIDRRYPLEQIVEAHRYVEQGHKRGNVVITVAG